MKNALLTWFILLFVVGIAKAQVKPGVTLSGLLKDKTTKAILPFVNISLKSTKDSTLVIGTITTEDGRFSLQDLQSGTYELTSSYVGYQSLTQPVLIGQLSNFLDLGAIELTQESKALDEVTVTAPQNIVSQKMDKKTFSLSDNLSQAG